jgi:hypothetical protein
MSGGKDNSGNCGSVVLGVTGICHRKCPAQDCPLSSHPYARKPIAQPSFGERPNIEIELTQMSRAWRKYRSINSRDAVYIYLSTVFAVVMRWRRLDCALKNARAALRLRPNPQRRDQRQRYRGRFCLPSTAPEPDLRCGWRPLQIQISDTSLRCVGN